jgi:hypothetical protein
MASENIKIATPNEQGFSVLLRHPLTVSIAALLIGSMLTSLVVPRLTYYRTLREKRLEKALEILTHDAEVTQRLNALLTTLEIFHKDNSGPAARLVDYKEEQKTLRRVMLERYLEFDRVAWWWYRKIRAEAIILQLTSPDGSARMDTLIQAYDSNLVQSTNILNGLWTRFLREEYRPTDRTNDLAMNQARKSLVELSLARQKIIDKLAQEFVDKAR